MTLTLDEAKALQVGTHLTFGSPYVFEVLSVEAFKHGVHIALKRDDGYLTHADQHMLHKAVIVDAPSSPAVVDSTPAPEWVGTEAPIVDELPIEDVSTREGEETPAKPKGHKRKK